MSLNGYNLAMHKMCTTNILKWSHIHLANQWTDHLDTCAMVVGGQAHVLQNERYSASEIGAAPVDAGEDAFTVNLCIFNNKSWIITQ